MTRMKRETSIPYIHFSIELHGCVEDPHDLAIYLKKVLRDKLDPDYLSDVEVELVESAGWKDAKNEDDCPR